MPKDSRYSSTKVLIETGHIKSFREIFDFIPKTIVYKDLQVNFNRFSRAVHNPEHLSIQELRVLAELFGIDAKRLIDMAYEQVLEAQKRRRPKTGAMPKATLKKTT